MKKKKPPHHDLETIMPLLIEQWRRFRGISGPGNVLQTREFRSVVKAVRELQEHQFSKQTPSNDDYFSSQEHLAAYLLYYWVVHYQEALNLINELPNSPKRVLDVCSGPAPYAFAALRHGATDVIATDRNLDALKQGAEICGRYGHTLTIRRWDCLKEKCPVEDKFDLIILSHGLAELFPDTTKGWKEEQSVFLSSLMNRLTPDGYLLLVDSSLLSHNHRILSIRDQFVTEGVPVQAPCVWRGECPALKTKNSPCYAQREFEKPYLVSEIQRGAKIFLSSLKMSYVIFSHPDSSWPNLPEGDYHRIISPPIDTHQGKSFYLCGTQGKKRISSNLRVLPKKLRAFDYLKRGELISVKEVIREGKEYILRPESEIKIEAACGKPIPQA
ncbi:MAG: small ribosomal subunit Rsm22 family protein [Chlamydiota bacterium]